MSKYLTVPAKPKAYERILALVISRAKIRENDQLNGPGVANILIKMIKLIVLVSIFLNVLEEGQARSCFTHHIEESIKINRESLKQYRVITDGESDKIYKKLIAGEKASLKIAASVDKKVEEYHQKGIDLLCQEFKDMALAQYKHEDARPSSSEPLKLKTFSFYQKINNAIKTKNENIIRKKTLEILIELNEAPEYHCFSRHIIESIYRFAYYVPLRKKQSVEKELKDPKKILFKVMKLQLLALPFAQHIDKQSITIQKKGIPILCHELPNLINDIPLEELNILKRNGQDHGKN